MLRILYLTLWLFAQAMHTSFTGVECNPKDESIKVFLKMTHNDFVFDYRFAVNDDQDFDPSGRIDTSAILVSRYVADRLQIYAGDEKLKGQITKLESAEGEIKIDLLYRYNAHPKSFRVKNTIFNGLFKNLSNLLIFKYNDIEEDVRMTEEKTEHTFYVKSSR